MSEENSYSTTDRPGIKPNNTGNVGNRIEQVTELAADKTQSAAAAIKDSLQSAKATALDAKDAVMNKAAGVAGSAKSYVGDNPWMAIGIAVGAGLLFGYLLSSRSSGESFRS